VLGEPGGLQKIHRNEVKRGRLVVYITGRKFLEESRKAVWRSIRRGGEREAREGGGGLSIVGGGKN